MKLTVVGMWGGYPIANEATSGYLIESDGYKVLLDVGSGVLSQVQHYATLDEINDIVISHKHHDHVADLGPFLFSRMMNYFMGKNKNALNIYAPEERLLRETTEAIIEKVDTLNIATFTSYDQNSYIEIGPFSITFHKNVHGVDTFAMRIQDKKGKVLVYTADTSYVDSLIEFTKNADVLLTECTMYDEDNYDHGHMAPKHVAKIAKDAHVDLTILTHFPHYGDTDELLTSVNNHGINNAIKAHPSLTVEI